MFRFEKAFPKGFSKDMIGLFLLKSFYLYIGFPKDVQTVFKGFSKFFQSNM